MRFQVNNRVSKLILFPSYVSKLTITHLDDFWRLVWSWKEQLERSLNWKVLFWKVLSKFLFIHGRPFSWKLLSNLKTFQLNDLSNCPFQIHVSPFEVPCFYSELWAKKKSPVPLGSWVGKNRSNLESLNELAKIGHNCKEKIKFETTA